jgi:hypothetical protein
MFSCKHSVKVPFIAFFFSWFSCHYLADNNHITKLDFLNGLMEKIKIYKKLKRERQHVWYCGCFCGCGFKKITFAEVCLKI